MNNAALDYEDLLKLFDDYKDMTLRQIIVFIEVAQNEGITVSEIREKHKITNAAASRITRTLGRFGYGETKGLDLLEYRIDTSDSRIRNVYLTDKGKSLISRVKR